MFTRSFRYVFAAEFDRARDKFRGLALVGSDDQIARVEALHVQLLKRLRSRK